MPTQQLSFARIECFPVLQAVRTIRHEQQQAENVRSAYMEDATRPNLTLVSYLYSTPKTWVNWIPVVSGRWEGRRQIKFKRKIIGTTVKHIKMLGVSKFGR